MGGKRPELREVVRRWAAEERPGDHPTPETLVEYHAGDLPAAGGEEVREHLASCPDCARLILDLETFGTEAEDLPRVPEGQMDEDWESLRERVRRDGELASVHELRPRRGPAPAAPRTGDGNDEGSAGAGGDATADDPARPEEEAESSGC